MPQAQWQAAAGGRYWIDVALAGHPLRVMIDLGLVDSQHRVGFEIDPALYDALEQAGHFSHSLKRSRRDASGQLGVLYTGQLTARLVCPVTRQEIGPTVSLYVERGAAGVPDRVGVVFFHGLTGCRVDWDLDRRTWRIDCP
jgi:hypothetical protein